MTINFKLAIIEHGIVTPEFIQQIQAHFSKKFNYDTTRIKLCNITNMESSKIHSSGPFNAVLYDTNFNEPNQSNAINSLLQTVTDPEDFAILPITDQPVIQETLDRETDKINSMLHGRNKDDKVFVVNLSNPEDVEPYFDGIIKNVAIKYLDFADEVTSEIAQKRQLYITNLLNAMEKKDPYTVGHLERVSKYSAAISEQLGWNPIAVENMRQIGLLHDIGKVGIVQDNLKSPNITTASERAQMDIHATAGASILDPTLFAKDELEGISHHHEIYHSTAIDEKERLEEEQQHNPYVSIISVADSLDTMSSQRAYNNPKNIVDTFRDLYSSARRKITRNGKEGYQFDISTADAAIIVLAKELTSLGYDSYAMIEAVSSIAPTTNDAQLLNLLKEHKDEIDSTPKSNSEYGILGFKLTDNGFFEFEDGKAPINDDTRIRSEYQFFISRYCRDNSITGDTINELEAQVPPAEREKILNTAKASVDKTNQLGAIAVRAGKPGKSMTPKDVLDATLTQRIYL